MTAPNASRAAMVTQMKPANQLLERLQVRACSKCNMLRAQHAPCLSAF
jgi:hypothetical protein